MRSRATASHDDIAFPRSYLYVLHAHRGARFGIPGTLEPLRICHVPSQCRNTGKGHGLWALRARLGLVPGCVMVAFGGEAHSVRAGRRDGQEGQAQEGHAQEGARSRGGTLKRGTVARATLIC